MSTPDNEAASSEAASPERQGDEKHSERHFERFDRLNRLLHATMMTSFMGLALTGLPLLFSSTPWAARWTHLLGGFEVAGGLHRLFAVVMLVTFAVHVGRIVPRLVVDRDWGILWGSRSMIAQPRDVVDLYKHFRWFLGLGPRPTFDRYTYWEKFDYWAVFWGMAIIGGSGLLLWFPELFARFVPGWFFNIALLVHGEEALLAVGFIFTIHFFNGQLRPDKFPMDISIFTGRVSESEMIQEHGDEYARLATAGELDQLAVDRPPGSMRAVGYLIGSVALTIGLLIVGIIIYSLATA